MTPAGSNRAKLVAMPIEARREELTAWMQGLLAGRVPSERLDPDRGSDPQALANLLGPSLHRQFGFPLYQYDTPSFRSIRSAADHVARELVPPPLPGVPLTDLYDKQNWGWGPLERRFGERLERPMVFILSAVRSGSTLLRVMLAGHPALFVPPELELLPFPSLGVRRAQAKALGHEWIRLGLLSAIGELGGLSVEVAAGETEALERNDVAMPAVFERLQRSASPRVLVDKSPLYAHHPEWLGYAERLFSQARYIHLVRHPASVIDSFVRMRFHRLIGRHALLWDENPWLHAEKIWAGLNRHIVDFLAGIEPERQLQVRFETLATEPAAVMNEICAFLGIRFDPAVLTPYSSQHSVRSLKANLPAIGDPNFRLRDSIDPAMAQTAGIPLFTFGAPTREVARHFQYEL